MGSSPLTRGKPLRVREARKHQGLIPAHAGKTGLFTEFSFSRGAHPRSRGENKTISPIASSLAGSSPLTRGKPLDAPANGAVRGLIPAHAGKTGVGIGGGLPSEAHPRSRGENTTATSSAASMMGSSPLTRGKLDARPRGRNHRRLIPAHAGKTEDRGFTGHATWAHPRSRGENLLQSLDCDEARGSSPLTRGKPASW